jgi:hypothetical protein
LLKLSLLRKFNLKKAHLKMCSTFGLKIRCDDCSTEKRFGKAYRFSSPLFSTLNHVHIHPIPGHVPVERTGEKKEVWFFSEKKYSTNKYLHKLNVVGIQAHEHSENPEKGKFLDTDFLPGTVEFCRGYVHVITNRGSQFNLIVPLYGHLIVNFI